MYCQGCGAKNTDDARFCNMCGSAFAKAGEVGGPVVASAPSPDAAAPGTQTIRDDGPRNHPGGTMVGNASPGTASAPSAAQLPLNSGDSGYGGASMMSVSLAGIGVRSSKKTWAAIVTIAVLLVGAGAAASWFARGNTPEDEGHANPDDPFLIGSPQPAGDGDVDTVAGTMGVETSAQTPNGSGNDTAGTMTSQSAMTRPSRMSTGSTMRPPSMTTTMAGTSSGSGTVSGQGGSNDGSGSTGSNGGNAGSGSAGSGSTGSGNTGSGSSGSGSTGTETGTEMAGSTMGTDSSMGSGTINPDDVPEERDIEMELYSSRVRYLIRRYYAARAQSCFDRATRNNPTVSGTVLISLTIGADGQVSGARVARNTTGNDNLGRCLSSQVGSWRLSPPPSGPVDMQIPFSR